MKKDKEITTTELAGMVADGFKRVMEEIGSVRSELKSEIGSVRSELKSEIGSVRSELKSEIGSVRSELKSFRQEVRTEFSKLWFEIDQIKHRLDKIEKTNNEEILILSEDIIKLKSRVHLLEQKIAKLKLANS